jgi:HlyD family secretion protein
LLKKNRVGQLAVNSAPEATYRALINLRSDYLQSQGRQLRLVPGMQVNAEIHLGTRSVLEYLLSPVQKVAHEAGRER